MREHLGHVLGRGAADLDPAHDDLLRPAPGRRRPGRRRRRPSPSGCPSGRAPWRCPRPSGPAPSTPTALDRSRGLTVGSATPGSRARPVVHEEDADQVRRDRRADDLQRGLLLGLQALLERQVAPLADRLRARPAGRGTAPWSCPGCTPRRPRRGTCIWSSLRPTGCCRCLAARASIRRLCCRYSISRHALLDQPLGGHGVEDQAERDGLRRPTTGSPEVIISIGRVDADQPRQPLRAAPGREQADLDLGQRDLGLRAAFETIRSSIDRTSSVPPPMQLPSIRATVGNGRRLTRLKSCGRTPMPLADLLLRQRTPARPARSGRPRR